MRYYYIITKPVQSWWDRQRFGDAFQERLKYYMSQSDDFDIANQQDSVQMLPNVFKTVNSTSSRPTFLWFKLVRNDVTLYVLRRAYKHDEYNRICPQGKKQAWKQKHELSDEEEKEVDLAFSKYLSPEKTEEKIVLPQLTGGELSFISSPLNINRTLFVDAIYETEEWIRKVKREEKESQFDEFSNAAQQIEAYIYNNIDSPNGWGQLSVKDKVILIYHIDQNWVLAELFDSKNTNEINGVLNSPAPKDFRRGYPFSFLSDQDQWRRMEQDPKSNLVLTEDQVEVVSNEIEYPLFITGRAGSGKSTVLQYMFVEIILRYMKNRKESLTSDILPPVYLSYSQNLINEALSLSETLLKKNHIYKDELDKLNLDYDEDIYPILNEMFFVFQDLLKKCVSDNQPIALNSRFSSVNYVSFVKFNSLWNERFGKDPEAAKNYSPSISWHVIRTYIKGWDCDKLMTPEEYENIPRNNRTVSNRTFKLVYDKVWNNWYSELENVWDDQDLVRYCLEQDFVKEQFSAVYCDEAQDFTRVELDFILKISSFSNRSISNVNDLKKLPFVFAGDEFQTLNPTGFSWDSLRGYFVERIFKLTGIEANMNESNLSRPIEFSENFRSTRQVVKLENRIQLLRATRFNEYSKPQEPHFSKVGSPVYCVSPQNSAFIEDMKCSQCILIIPAADGESAQGFIEKTSLKGKIDFDENGTPQGITILNPTQAKGLEFPNVVLYGFNLNGINAELSINSLLTWFASPTDDLERDIELKYQLSNAYVAVTRATSNLYILDEFKQHSFWAFAFNNHDSHAEEAVNSLQNKMFSRLSAEKREIWNDSLLGYINFKSDVKFSSDGYTDSKEDLANLEKNAATRRDSQMMRQVACRYKEAGSKIDEARCKAFAYEFELKFLDAANNFDKAKMFDNAISCYWQELNTSNKTSQIVNKVAKLRPESYNKKAAWCSNYNRPLSLEDLKNALADVVELFNNGQEAGFIQAWQNAANYIITLASAKNKDHKNEFDVIMQFVNELQAVGIKLDVSKLAKLAFDVGSYPSAILLWKGIDSTNYPKEYYIAQLKVNNFPHNLPYYEGSGIKNWEVEVLEEFKKHETVTLTEQQKLILSRIIRTNKKARDYFFEFMPYMLRSALNISDSERILEEAKQNGIQFNKDAVMAVTYTRVTDLRSWKKPNIVYEDKNVDILFDAIDLISKLRSRSYEDVISRSLKSNPSIKEFVMTKFGKYARTAVIPLLIVELGKFFEGRNKFRDSILFYEHAKNLTSDPKLKRLLDIRWIVCMERYAEFRKDDEGIIFDATMKRKELNLLDSVFQDVPSMSPDEWEKLYSHSLQLSDVVVSKTEKRRRKRIGETETEKPAEPKVLTNPESVAGVNTESDEKQPKVTSKKQVFQYDDYKLTFLPQKGDLLVSYDTDEDSRNMKIKKGVFPQDGDFYLKEGTLYVSDTNEKTPLRMEVEGSLITVKFVDNDSSTGVSMQFESNPSEI